MTRRNLIIIGFLAALYGFGAYTAILRVSLGYFLQYLTFPAFCQFVFLFLVPFSAFMFLRGSKAGYILILFYAFYNLFPAIEYTVFFRIRLGWHEKFLTLAVFPFLINLALLAAMLQKNTLRQFNLRVYDVLLIILTSLLMSFFQQNYLPPMLVFPLVFLAPVITAGLLMVMVVWAIRLFRKNAPPVEGGEPMSTLYGKMSAMVITPFIILIFWYFLVLQPLLGPGMPSSDDWWGGKTYSPSLFYNPALYLSIIFPASATFFWFHRALKKKPALKNLAYNCYWSVFLLYAVGYSFLMIASFATW